MTEVVQWATILSPIIAVGLAWWTVRSSSKDTAKKIDAIEQSTNREIERLKEISRLQIEVALVRLKMEQLNSRIKAKQTAKKRSDMVESNNSMLNILGHDYAADYRSQHEKQQNIEYESEYLEKTIQSLEKYVKQLEKIKAEI